MSEVVAEYGPIDPYWTLEQELSLSPGQWVAVDGFRVYSEQDADQEAQKLTRQNFTNYRVVSHDSEGTPTPGTVFNPPTSWYTVEKEDSPDMWSPVNNPDGGQKFWSLGEAQAEAQSAAREHRARTRVTTVGS